MSDETPAWAVDDTSFEASPEPDVTPEWQEFDVNGDGVVDGALTRFGESGWTVVSDENGDHGADTVMIDIDGDQSPELVITREGDSYLIRVDQDGDGVFEVEQSMTREELETTFPDVGAQLDMQFSPADQPDSGTGEDGIDWVVQDGRLVGDPTGDAEHWFEQSANGFCVPSSVAQIVSEYTGHHFADEQEFVTMANELKVFVVGPDGVPGIGLDGAQQMLVASGVPAHLDPAGTIPKLVDHLDEGRRIILAVDSGEIWGTEAIEDNAADHAVVITGIDEERGVAILSDPGAPDGNQAEISIRDLEDAWRDSDNAMVVCDTAPGAPVPTGAPVPGPDAGGNSSVPEGLPIPARDGDAQGFNDSGPLDTTDGRLQQTVKWVGDHPYVLLAVVLPAAALAKRSVSQR